MMSGAWSLVLIFFVSTSVAKKPGHPGPEVDWSLAVTKASQPIVRIGFYQNSDGDFVSNITLADIVTKIQASVIGPDVRSLDDLWPSRMAVYLRSMSTVNESCRSALDDRDDDDDDDDDDRDDDVGVPDPIRNCTKHSCKIGSPELFVDDVVVHVFSTTSAVSEARPWIINRRKLSEINLIQKKDSCITCGGESILVFNLDPFRDQNDANPCDNVAYVKVIVECLDDVSSSVAADVYRSPFHPEYALIQRCNISGELSRLYLLEMKDGLPMFERADHIRFETGSLLAFHMAASREFAEETPQKCTVIADKPAKDEDDDTDTDLSAVNVDNVNSTLKMPSTFDADRCAQLFLESTLENDEEYNEYNEYNMRANTGVQVDQGTRTDDAYDNDGKVRPPVSDGNDDRSTFPGNMGNNFPGDARFKDIKRKVDAIKDQYKKACHKLVKKLKNGDCPTHHIKRDERSSGYLLDGFDLRNPKEDKMMVATCARAVEFKEDKAYKNIHIGGSECANLNMWRFLFNNSHVLQKALYWSARDSDDIQLDFNATILKQDAMEFVREIISDATEQEEVTAHLSACNPVTSRMAQQNVFGVSIRVLDDGIIIAGRQAARSRQGPPKMCWNNIGTVSCRLCRRRGGRPNNRPDQPGRA